MGPYCKWKVLNYCNPQALTNKWKAFPSPIMLNEYCHQYQYLMICNCWYLWASPAHQVNAVYPSLQLLNDLLPSLHGHLLSFLQSAAHVLHLELQALLDALQMHDVLLLHTQLLQHTRRLQTGSTASHSTPSGLSLSAPCVCVCVCTSHADFLALSLADLSSACSSSCSCVSCWTSTSSFRFPLDTLWNWEHRTALFTSNSRYFHISSMTE